MVDKCDGHNDCPNNYDEAASVCSKLKRCCQHIDINLNVEMGAVWTWWTNVMVIKTALIIMMKQLPFAVS